jgi:hypothetical protein
MARRHAAAGRARGGAGIPALRPSRARLITGAGATAALCGALALPVFAGGRFAPLAWLLAGVSLFVFALALVARWPNAIPWAMLLAGTAYLAGRSNGSVVDGWSAVAGGLLLLSAELATWSVEDDPRLQAERALTARRIVTLVVLVLVALFVDFVLLATAAVSSSASVLLAAVGVAATVAAVALVLRLVRA